MFTMVIIIIGVIEFFMGVLFTVFSNSKNIYNIFASIYSETEVENEDIIVKTNRCIGENAALTGSLYIFVASSTYAFDIGGLILIVLLGCIEIYSYNRTSKALQSLIKETQ